MHRAHPKNTGSSSHGITVAYIHGMGMVVMWDVQSPLRAGDEPDERLRGIEPKSRREHQMRVIRYIMEDLQYTVTIFLNGVDGLLLDMIESAVGEPSGGGEGWNMQLLVNRSRPRCSIRGPHGDFGVVLWKDLDVSLGSRYLYPGGHGYIQVFSIRNTIVVFHHGTRSFNRSDSRRTADDSVPHETLEKVLRTHVGNPKTHSVVFLGDNGFPWRHAPTICGVSPVLLQSDRIPSYYRVDWRTGACEPELYDFAAGYRIPPVDARMLGTCKQVGFKLREIDTYREQ